MLTPTRCPRPRTEATVNLAIVAAVYPIIFIGELPDKTMFASLVMSTRGRPWPVWLGAAGAFVVHVTIATTVGVALFRLLPHRAVEGIVALMFLVGAALAVREGLKVRDEEPLIEREAASGQSVAMTAFIVIFLAEWGDLTQILTANLAAHYHSPLSVGTGAVLALWTVAALAVIGGQGLLRFVNIRTVRFVTAGLLVLLAGVVGFPALR
jgi:putative Ca2+/H+ antiporter (TMEM165/GDT1 family)